MVQYLLRAIHQVTLGIATRTGLLPPSEAQVDEFEPRKVVDQDEQSLEAVLEVLLWIADALDIKSRPQPSPQRQRTVRVLRSSPPPPEDPEAYSRAAPGSMQGKLFSRQSQTQPSPRRLRTALSDMSSPSKRHLATTHKRPPSAAASEPGPVPQLGSSASPPPLRSGPPPSTPTRRDRLSTATTTSFLAELARARSPAQAASASSSHTSIERDTIGARSPPTSPRKSIVEVMRSLELRRTEQAHAAPGVDRRPKRSPQGGVPQDPVLRKAAESAHPFTARSGTKLRSDFATSSPPPPPSSSSSSSTSSASGFSSRPPSNRKTARRRSRPTEADGRPPDSGGSTTIDPLPPCTCTCTVSENGSTPTRHPQEHSPSVPSASPPSPAPPTSAQPSRHPRGRSRSGSATWPSSSPASSTPTNKRTPPPHRVRVSRISPTNRSSTAASNTPNALESGLLSVHSSTDLELDSPPGSKPPAPSAAPCTPPPLTHPNTISYGASSITDTTSPYTLLLLAHRDRLREKLRILERRERDRKAAAAATARAEPQTKAPLPGGDPGITAGVAG